MIPLIALTIFVHVLDDVRPIALPSPLLTISDLVPSKDEIFPESVEISPYRVWEAGTFDMMKIPYQRRYKE